MSTRSIRTRAVAIWALRWRSLKAWGRPLEEVAIRVRERSADCGDYSTGRASATLREVVITAGSDMPDALATILHEYAHTAAPAGEGHGPKWQRLFAEAAEEVTGVPLPREVENVHHLDREVTEAVGLWWKRSGNEFAWGLVAGRGKRG